MIATLVMIDDRERKSGKYRGKHCPTLTLFLFLKKKKKKKKEFTPWLGGLRIRSVAAWVAAEVQVQPPILRKVTGFAAAVVKVTAVAQIQFLARERPSAAGAAIIKQNESKHSST